VVLLLSIGAIHDLWRARHPALAPTPGPWTSPADESRGVSAGDTASRPVSSSPPPAAGEMRGGGPVDLNRATLADLDALPGIGPVLAGRILEHRKTHGPFRSLEELLAVRGIGPRLLERLRPGVVVRPLPARGNAR
jgi:competence protein ComEA